MRHWIKRLLSWARDRLLSRQPRAITATMGAEHRGETRWQTPMLWTADAVVLDVVLRAPLRFRRKLDFAFRLPHALIPADTIRTENDDHIRVSFRFPVPQDSTRGDLLWRGRVLATVPIEVLTQHTFLSNLTLSHSSVAIQYRETTATAESFVPDNSTAMGSVIVLRSESSLAPLAEIDVYAVFRSPQHREVRVRVVPLAAQLRAKEAVLIATLPRPTWDCGVWWISWFAGERLLNVQRLQAVDAMVFAPKVRVVESRFAVMNADGRTKTTKHPPILTDDSRVGPCFVLSATEAGTVAACQFELRTIPIGDYGIASSHLAEFVVGDLPRAFVPKVFSASELNGVSGFSLRLNGREVGGLSLCPIPAAKLTAEGGYTEPPEFLWSAAAEEELAERLKRLQK